MRGCRSPIFEHEGHGPKRVSDRIFGSNIHVMLGLRRSSRQVVMADEELNRTNMVGQLLRNGQRLAHQAVHTLPQGVVEPLQVSGLKGQFADRMKLRCGKRS